MSARIKMLKIGVVVALLAGAYLAQTPTPASASACSTTNTTPGWTQCTAALPTAVSAPASAYDAAHHTVVVFGGCKKGPMQPMLATVNSGGPGEWTTTDDDGAIKPFCAQATDDTYVWNGSAWSTFARPAGTTDANWPHPRFFASMTWDKSSNKALLFGGVSTGTDSPPPAGASLCWGDEWMMTNLTNNPVPPNTYGYRPTPITSVVGPDPNTTSPTPTMPLYAYCFNDTWLWNGSTWSKQTVTSVTYSYNGSSFVTTTSSSPPPARFDASIASEGCATGDSGCVSTVSSSCFTDPACSTNPPGLPTLFGGCGAFGIWGNHGDTTTPYYWDCGTYSGIEGPETSIKKTSCQVPSVNGVCAVPYINSEPCRTSGDVCYRSLDIGDTWTWASTGTNIGVWREDCPGRCPRYPPQSQNHPDASFTSCTPLFVNWNGLSLCSPHKRDGAPFTYDPVSQTFQMFGGYQWDPWWEYISSGWNDTWQWRTTGQCVDNMEGRNFARNAPCWQQQMDYDPASNWGSPQPPRRAWSALAPRPGGGTLLFGGSGSVPLQADTSGTPYNQDTTNTPINGLYERNPATLNDLWAWNPSVCTDGVDPNRDDRTCWNKVQYYVPNNQTGGVQPVGREGQAFVYAPALHQIVLTGGLCSCPSYTPSGNLGDPSTWSPALRSDTWTYYVP